MRGLFSGLTEKQRILKNFIAFNLSFLFLFASFDDVALVASKTYFSRFSINFQLFSVLIIIILRYSQSRSRLGKYISGDYLRFSVDLKLCLASTFDSAAWLQNFSCHWTSGVFPLLFGKCIS